MKNMENREDFKINDTDIIRIITNTLIPPNETIRDAIKIFNERFDEYNKIFDVRQIKTKYTTTLNPIDKEDLEKAMRIL